MDAAGHKLKLLDQLYFHWWRLAADIPVAAGSISYLFSFESEYIFFIIQCTLITDSHSLRHIRCHIDFLWLYIHKPNVFNEIKKKCVDFKCYEWNFKNMWFFSVKFQKCVNFGKWFNWNYKNMWILTIEKESKTCEFCFTCFLSFEETWIFSTCFDTCEIANFTCFWKLISDVFTCEIQVKKPVKLNHNTSVLQAFDCGWSCSWTVF